MLKNSTYNKISVSLSCLMIIETFFVLYYLYFIFLLAVMKLWCCDNNAYLFLSLLSIVSLSTSSELEWAEFRDWDFSCERKTRGNWVQCGHFQTKLSKNIFERAKVNFTKNGLLIKAVLGATLNFFDSTIFYTLKVYIF